MKKIFLSLLVFAAVSAKAETPVRATADVTAPLTKALEADPTYAAGIGQGWVATVAQINCYDPQGTDNPRDHKTCELATRKGSSSAQPINNRLLVKALVRLMAQHQDQFYVGMGQGWDAYAAVVNCYSSEGTGNTSDQPYCEFSKAE